LLSVNVLTKYLDICHFSVYHCVYSVLSQLSIIVPNNVDSHKSNTVCIKMSKLAS